MMILHGEINTAIHSSLEDLRNIYDMTAQWLEEYPDFEEGASISESIGTALEYYETEDDDEEESISFAVSTESAATVLNFIDDIAQEYPEAEIAVAAKIIYPNTESTEYFSYFSPKGENTVFAMPEDPFCDENHIIAEVDQWDGWDEEEKGETDDENYLLTTDWGFPEDADWIDFIN